MQDRLTFLGIISGYIFPVVLVCYIDNNIEYTYL